jgi:hypothetical protein
VKTRTLAEGEILREGRRALRKLAVQDATLVPAPQGFDYRLVTPRREGPKRGMLVSAELVHAFQRRGWLAPLPNEPHCFAISEAGLGWVRRALAEDDPFAAQHRIETQRSVLTPDGSVHMLTVNDGESPLGWLFRRNGPDGRGLITEWQFKAGERLRQDFTLGSSPRVWAWISRRRSSPDAVARNPKRCRKPCSPPNSALRGRWPPWGQGSPTSSSMCAVI